MTLEELEQEFWKLKMRIVILEGFLVGGGIIDLETYNSLVEPPKEKKRKKRKLNE